MMIAAREHMMESVLMSFSAFPPSEKEKDDIMRLKRESEQDWNWLCWRADADNYKRQIGSMQVMVRK